MDSQSGVCFYDSEESKDSHKSRKERGTNMKYKKATTTSAQILLNFLSQIHFILIFYFLLYFTVFFVSLRLSVTSLKGAVHHRHHSHHHEAE